MKKITDLRLNQCRYPIGDDGGSHRFCGDLTPEGKPYCTMHHKLAYKRKPASLRYMQSLLNREALGYVPAQPVARTDRLDVEIDVWLQINRTIGEIDDDDDA